MQRDESGSAVATQTHANGSRLKILVVDDNVDVAETLGWLLTEMGHDYRLVHDGRMALDAARELRPHAVLLDIGMPTMDGYEVCRVLRDDPLLKDTPIIAQTGWGQENDKAETAKAGFDYHIVKPVGFSDLERVLATAVLSKEAAVR
jgi:CheY-like chemotaxis protein